MLSGWLGAVPLLLAATTAVWLVWKTNDSNNAEPPITHLILNLGLPRTGSLALHRFLQCHSICSHHYCCCSGADDDAFPCASCNQTCGACLHRNFQTETDNAFAQCGGSSCHTKGVATTENGERIVAFMQFDVETTKPFSWFLPQHFALPLLLSERRSPRRSAPFKRHIWILPRRVNATVWANSVLHWYSVTRRLFHAFSLPYYNDDDHHDPREEVTVELQPEQNNNNPISQASLFQELQRVLETRLNASSSSEHVRRRQLLEAVYERHLRRVTHFAEAHSSDVTLIPVNVDDANAGHDLHRALAQALPTAFDKKEQAMVVSCWQWEAAFVDDDWKNWTLPFR